MTLFESIILAVVEGLTEFLPVSSTGHMVIAQALLGIESTPYVKAFTVMIQFGAILAVVLMYYRYFFDFSVPPALRSEKVPLWRKAVGRVSFYLKLIVALIPAVVLGLLFDDWVDEVLGKVWVIALNLVVGGVIMLFIDRWVKRGTRQNISYVQAFAIGLFQCIAMFFPGMSRSMSTIVGGMVVGLDRKRAAEFSFFLAVPTMFGASLLQVIKLFRSDRLSILQDNMLTLVVGNVVAFLVAAVAIRYFIMYIQRHSFRAFGLYRIIVGGLILAALALGMDLAIIH